MAVLDFVCSPCRGFIRDRVAPMGTPPPACPECGAPMEILWIGRAPSVGFSRPVEFEDDDGSVRHFHSVEEIHRFEKQTEDEVRNGTRPRPFVFREFSQSLSSNRDKNVFQHLHPQVPREQLLQTRRGKPIISAKGIDVKVFGDPGAPPDEEG